jgi:hypothetical protein
MQMCLLVTPTLQDGDLVIFDSEHPEKSEDKLGRWWQHEIYVNPNLIHIGAVALDGLNSYEVIYIHGPLFDIGRIYSMRFSKENAGQEGPGVKVTHRWLTANGEYLYSIVWGFSSLEYVMKEQNLLKFLTEPVDDINDITETQ